MYKVVLIDVVKAVEYIYELLIGKNNDKFSEKFVYLRAINEQDIRNLKLLKKIKLAKILKDINLKIDSKLFEYKKIYTTNRLVHHFNEFQRQIKINVYAKYDEEENRVLFHYNPIPTYNNDWNNLTKVARGIVIDLDDYSIVAHPYNKFHNLGEKEHLLLENLPKIPYEVASKLDGSEGILYPSKDGKNVKIITKGGLNTEQGQFGTKILLSKYKDQVKKIIDNELFKYFTFTFEILYSKDDKNRIVVAYDEPDLRLIGIRDLRTGEELSYTKVIEAAKDLGFPSTELHDITFEDIEELKGTMENFEGWVIRFRNGLYVKVKCSAYLDSHGAKFGSSPKYVFNLLAENKYDDFIATIPVDMRHVPDKFKNQLIGWATELTNKVTTAYDSIPEFETQKEFALYVRENIDNELQGHIFGIKKGKEFDPFKIRWSIVKFKYAAWVEINETTN